MNKVRKAMIYGKLAFVIVIAAVEYQLLYKNNERIMF